MNLKESINIVFSFRIFFYRKELNAGKEQLVKQNVMATDRVSWHLFLFLFFLFHRFDVFLFLIIFRFKLMAGGCKWILSLREGLFELGGS